MSGSLKRAKLVPYDTGGKNLQTDKAIKFDFNPETLTLKVSTGQQQDKSRRGRQQRQTVGASSATLSFDAIFDTTRPKDHDRVDRDDLNDDTALDVRKRTKPIADLLAALPKSGGGGSGGTDKAPARVQFQWGTTLFDGVITSHQETFDFFAPSGVPLRSKVQLTLTEQNFIYAVKADDVARTAAAAAAAPSTVRDAAAASGADSLFTLGPDGRPLGFSADLSLDVSFSAGISLSGQLGISADFGVSLDAGFSLDASAAIDVFGSAALSINGPGGGDRGGAGGGGDIGQAGLARLAPMAAQPVGATPPPSPWAPDGPPAGSSAAGLASVVNAMRAGGAAVPPPGGPGAPASTTPAPIRGSPPPALPRTLLSADTVYASSRLMPQQVLDGDRLPRWQKLSAIAATVAASPHQGRCGCRTCRGC